MATKARLASTYRSARRNRARKLKVLHHWRIMPRARVKGAEYVNVA